MEIDASSASSDSNISQYNPNNNQSYYSNSNGVNYCTFKKTDYDQYVNNNAKYYSSLSTEKKMDMLFSKDNKKDGNEVTKKIVNFDNGGFYTTINSVNNKNKDYTNGDGKKIDDISTFYGDGRNGKIDWNKKSEGTIHLNTVDPFPKKTLSFSPEQVRKIPL